MTGAVGTSVARPARDAGTWLGQTLSLPRWLPEVLLERIRLVVRTLEEQPGLTSQELADLIGSGRRHVSLLLLRLEEHGHVAHQGRRWFAATSRPAALQYILQ